MYIQLYALKPIPFSSLLLIFQDLVHIYRHTHIAIQKGLALGGRTAVFAPKNIIQSPSIVQMRSHSRRLLSHFLSDPPIIFNFSHPSSISVSVSLSLLLSLRPWVKYSISLLLK